MNKKPVILIFIDWYLPGYRAGGPIQSCANLVAHLKKDFNFSIVTRNTDYMTYEPYREINSNAWNILPDGSRVFYFSPEKLSKKGVNAILENEEYDYLYLNGIFSKYFTLFPLHYCRGNENRKVIVASRGMLTESALAIKKWKKILFLFIAKQFRLFENVLFHVTNEAEAASVRKIFGENTQIHVAPNLTEKPKMDEWRQKNKSFTLLKLVSVARIAPEKNIKYALEILENIKTDVQYDLFGPIYDDKYWNECKEVIRRLPANVKVNFMNSVESRWVTETISQYDFLFLPTQGENFGHVILQAMSVAVPVIISDKTMWRQLEDKNTGWDIPLSDRNQFVSVIERCSTMSQAEYNRLSKCAFDFFRSYTNNNELMEMNRQLFLK